MNVLVVGGTGFVGERLCAELHDRGHDVTALARDPADADLPEGIDRVAGDVTDYDDVEGAFEGQDAVYFLPALSPLFEPAGGNEMHFRVHRDGTANAVAAAEEHGVDRYVQMSALGADPGGTTAYIRAKGEAETIVRESDLAWTIFRPSIVFGDGGEFVSFTLKLTPPGVAPLPGGGKTPFQPIWVEDLVPMLVDAVEDDAHIGQVYEIGGPEVLTLAAVAKLGRRAKGQSVTILPIPMSLAGIGLSIAGAIPGFPMGVDQYRSLQFDNTVSDNDIDAFGVAAEDLTTLGEYLGIEG